MHYRIQGGAPKARLVWPSILDQFGDLLPPFPGPDVLRVAQLPSPPRVRRGVGDRERAWQLAQSYRSVIEHYYGRCWALSRETKESILSCKFGKAMVTAAGLMEELRIAPIPWCAFSVHAWRSHVVTPRARSWDEAPSQYRRGPSPSTPPGPRWVFAATRFRERAGWFSWYEQCWLGGRVVTSSANLEAYKLYNTMKLRLIARSLRGTLTRDDVITLVRETLPKARLDRLKEKAEVEADWKEAEWSRQLREGKFIWESRS